MPLAQYLQNYDPVASPFLSTLLAAVPIVVLLYLLALHPVRRADGSLHLGIAAHWAALASLVTAFLMAWLVFKMPAPTATMSMVYGGLTGLFPIGWIVVSAMFLYTITLVSGTFETVKNSVARLSDDRRVQAILIAFSFGAFVEGAAGFGTPVAISGALMVGLGFRPRDAAILCLIANTAPVAYGALGTPITTLATVTDMNAVTLGKMAARQLPFFSLIVPVWMTAVQVRMAGGPWRDVWAVWPALLVGGGSFALTQFVVGNYMDYHLVDIAGGVVSMAAVALLCKVWKPRRAAAAEPPTVILSGAKDLAANGEVPSQVRTGPDSPARSFGVPQDDGPRRSATSRSVLFAWLPWAILVVLVFLWGYGPVKARLNSIPNAVPEWRVNEVQDVVFRTPPVVPAKSPEKAVYKFEWVSTAGTAIFISAIVAGLICRLRPSQWRQAVTRTGSRVALPLLTIVLILAMGFVTKYSGMDAVLGLAFTKTGVLYPFFSAMLGRLGVALTGSDTASNVMFGSMQKITAEQMGLSPVLIVTSNSTGGVMGKMIDAQSIVVATAACYEDRKEGKLAAGPIFRAVLPHSIVLAALMGLLVMAQAYWWPWMVP
ncbi:MAG TPA: L-lactate permease [Tepidisphaeraceae bacterium]|nr:L-lactate permease [Tepidisphaeraceae bacterium]